MQKLLINSKRLVIRNLKPSDLHDFFRYRSNPAVTKYQGFDTMTLEQAEAFIDSHKLRPFGQPGEWVQYAIENNQTHKLIGDCAIRLDRHDARIAQVGITMSHLEQQKGYATETLTAILDFLFAIKDFHRVVEIVDAENTASVRMLERVGFKKEGHFVENIFFKGNWGSEFQYAMLRKDWEAIRNKH
jgi:ribosomal-protein-alanine N-acetyltransferase